MRLLETAKGIAKTILYIFIVLSCQFLNASDDVFLNDITSLESNLDKIKKTQSKLKLQYIYNQGVSALKQENYEEAISFFDLSIKSIRIPSLLNLGVCYYHLKQNEQAILNFEKIINTKDIKTKNYFAYLSSNYYLFLITKDEKYTKNAFDSYYGNKMAHTPQSTRLILDLHILLKEYKKSITLLEELNEGDYFKLGILHAKIKDYKQSQKYLLMAYNSKISDSRKNDVLWVKVFIDLKSNNIRALQEDLKSLSKRKKGFKSHIKMPLQIFFNKNMKTSDEHLAELIHPSLSDKIDMIYYFAPYLFFDDENIMHTLAPKFATNKTPTKSKETLEYDKKLLKILQLEPIKRSLALEEHISSKTDAYAYEYYNTALAYAQIKDYKNAYTNFLKAHRLNKGNNLYIAMLLATLKKVDVVLDKEEEIAMLQQLRREQGDYDYFAKQIYNILNNNYFDLGRVNIAYKHKKTLFYRALNFLNNYDMKDEKAFSNFNLEDEKNDLISLFFMLKNTNNLNRQNYIAKVQNTIPVKYNEHYLKSSWIVTDFYIKMLKAFGLFDIKNFNLVDGGSNPSYLKTKAYVYLFNDKSKVARVLLTMLQKKYKLKDIDTNYYLAAAMLDMNDEANAWSVFWDMEYLYKNSDARFLNALRLLSEFKIDSAVPKLNTKYHGKMIDFSLQGYEALLQTL